MTKEFDAVLSQRFSFIGFDDKARATLRSMKPVVEAELPAILESFYADIARQPEADATFADDAMRRHAREKQYEHWLRIVDATYGDDYLKSVRRIGEAHARLGLKPAWYFGGYAKLVSGLVRAVATHAMKQGGFGHRAARATALEEKIDVLIKAAMLDMDLCITTIEERAAADKAAERDRLATAFERDIGGIVETLAAASEELAVTARNMANLADRTTGRSSTMAAAAEQVSSASSSVARAAGELTHSIREISERAQGAAATSSGVSEDARATSATMQQLAQAAEKIGEIVGLIDSVAAQTNLLALNATIEAARAGDAGKGFAVVASEVKSLATQTARATDEISSQIVAIQEVMKTAVGAIERVGRSVESVNSATASISAAVEEQNAATSEISSQIDDTARSATSVSSTISEVLSDARETSVSAEAMVSAANELSKQAEGLRTGVASFLSRIRSAA
ncbi:protoglobin domain-containing protein [Amorphus sp. MBR-141]